MRSGGLAVILCLYAALAFGQFKWVDENGRKGFGDKPPPGARKVERLDGYLKGSTPDALASLPYEVRRLMQTYPVTLYTMAACPGCDQGRSFLKRRAIPFEERTVATKDDLLALKALSGSEQLPVFQIGGQRLIGFNSARWDDALNVVGYPNDIQLPADWKWPAPRPLGSPGTGPASPAVTPTAPAPSGAPAQPPPSRPDAAR